MRRGGLRQIIPYRYRNFEKMGPKGLSLLRCVEMLMSACRISSHTLFTRQGQ